MAIIEEDEEIGVFVLLTCINGVCAKFRRRRYIPRAPSRNRDIERKMILRRLYSESDKECHEQLRMNIGAFESLCIRLQAHGLRNGRYVDVKEQVAIFLWMIGHDKTNRALKFSVIRSGETISRHFHNVLKAILSMYKDIVKQPGPDSSPQNSDYVRSWYHYFQDAIGAIDGTYVPATVPLADQPRYRNRSGDIGQNVLVACNFDMSFVYVLAGWEGSAHDGRVLRDACRPRRDRLTIPTGKYYLADAGFANVPGFLTPFRGVRYHLRNTRDHRPRNARELYNYRHSSLRTVVERVIGVVKRRFRYLKRSPSYPIRTQTLITLACCAIHNFIREVDPNDLCQDEEEDEDGQANEDDDLLVDEEIINLERSQAWMQKREALANLMWEEYDQRHP